MFSLWSCIRCNNPATTVYVYVSQLEYRHMNRGDTSIMDPTTIHGDAQFIPLCPKHDDGGYTSDYVLKATIEAKKKLEKKIVDYTDPQRSIEI